MIVANVRPSATNLLRLGFNKHNQPNHQKNSSSNHKTIIFYIQANATHQQGDDEEGKGAGI